MNSSLQIALSNLSFFKQSLCSVSLHELSFSSFLRAFLCPSSYLLAISCVSSCCHSRCLLTILIRASDGSWLTARVGPPSRLQFTLFLYFKLPYVSCWMSHVLRYSYLPLDLKHFISQSLFPLQQDHPFIFPRKPFILYVWILNYIPSLPPFVRIFFMYTATKTVLVFFPTQNDFIEQN